VLDVRGHEHRSALAALAFDVLSRQAEGRALLAGRALVEGRATEHEVTEEDAECELGNLLTVLERGAANARERALVSAFAVAGFDDRLTEAEEGERQELLERFLRHADWLETATPYAVYPFVDELVEEPSAERVWLAVADAVVGASERDPRTRARQLVRIGALAAAGPTAAKGWERMVRGVTDPVVRATAGALAEQADAPHVSLPPPPPRLSGTIGAVPRKGVRAVLRWITGYALVAWVGRGLAALLRYRRVADVELVHGGVRLTRRDSLLGRRVRDAQETYVLSAIAGVGREARFPVLAPVVGALSLSLGLLVGGVFAFDGVRTGETILLLLAASVVLLGAGLDFVLSVLLPARAHTVSFFLRLIPKREVRLVGVDQDQAERFLSFIEGRLGTRRYSADVPDVAAASAEEPPDRSTSSADSALAGEGDGGLESEAPSEGASSDDSSSRDSSEPAPPSRRHTRSTTSSA
jgi:hypothetical protein